MLPASLPGEPAVPACSPQPGQTTTDKAYSPGPRRRRNLWILSKIHRLIIRDEGQDLIEYALVVASLAFAAIASMNMLATDIAVAFVNIGMVLSGAV